MVMKFLILSFFLISFASAKEKLNVLFIAVDDLKPMIGAYGFKQVKTPNIDTLAEQGTIFLKNYCQWPVCGGSRASLMSGLYPESTGVMDLKTKMRDSNPSIVSLPEYLKNNGYQTGGVGKIYDPRCVDSKKKADAPSWTVPFIGLSHGKIKAKDGNEFAGILKADDSETTDGTIALEGINLLKKFAADKKPFFLAVGFKKPHLPFYAPEKYWNLYSEKDISLAENDKPSKNASIYGWHDSPEFRGYGGVPKNGPISDNIKRKAIHGYLACTSFIDAQVGLLLNELKKLNLDKNTVVVFWGDHGFHLGDHGMWGKHTTLEQAAAAPLIIKVPDSKARAVNATSGLIDIYPTICDSLGLGIPNFLQGKSQFGVISGKTEKVREGIITCFKSKGATGYSFRTERYRYIEWIKKGKIEAVELYDYENDPAESENIASTSKGKKLCSELSSKMRNEGEGCKDLYLKQAQK